MIASLGLSAFLVFVVLAFTVFVVLAFTVFVVPAFTVFVLAAVVLEVFAFAVEAFLERILLPFEDSFSRFPMVPAPSSFELVHLFVLHSNGDGKIDSASASNAVDR